MQFRKIIAGLALASMLAGCSATPGAFYANPSKPGATALCRSFLETHNSEFRGDVASELDRRGLTLEDCERRVATENVALAAIAVTAVGVGVAAACSNGCAAPRYQAFNATQTDYDCRGGSGDGPFYTAGPTWVGSNDPYGLDADDDGWGCELSDIAFGS